MNDLARHVIGVMGMLAAVLMSSCCGDVGGPGARGTISLGPGENTSQFVSLEIRTFPDDGAPFDASKPLPTGTGFDFFAARMSLPGISFPKSYEVGRNTYGTDKPRWRIVAWLSKTAQSNAIAPGDVYGTKSYDANDCGSCSGFCGKTEGVDVVLESVAR